ncbi:MAG: hypothetical protein IKQ05_01850 [Prevotella sp.]|nr:hypothetical protein [Prevotella sp.]
MKKYVQNRIAESWLTLPSVGLYSLVVWILSGLITHSWWLQLACMVISTYLMAELSNASALIRVRSRMVSSVFLALSTTATFLFGSLPGGFVQLCFIAMLILLFRTYQDRHAPGWTFYGFLCIGLASMVFVQIFFFVPLLWLVMLTQLQSLRWRSWTASLIGLLTPYWFASAWVAYRQDISLAINHFRPLAEFPFPYAYATLTVGQVLVFAFTITLMILGVVHFWNKSFEDKIRIRQLYGGLLAISLFSIAFLVLQPQHYDALMRIIVVCANPFIAHLFTLTHTRITNILFCTTAVLTLLLTAFCLFMPEWSSLNNMFSTLWNGLLTF